MGLIAWFKEKIRMLFKTDAEKGFRCGNIPFAGDGERYQAVGAVGEWQAAMGR